MKVFKDDRQIADFFQKAVLAQMQGHPVIGGKHVDSTRQALIENAKKLTVALIKYDLEPY